ncbi:ABC transporter substrate-binding protein [Intrasporangium mesophilum]
MPPTLRTLTRPQGANRALLDRTIAPSRCSLDFVDEPVLVRGFRAMVRELAYDVSEMALTTYLTAREHGVPFTALPVFLVRGFHHGAILVRRDGPIASPADLAGGRVGVNRGYTVTTGVWARAVLATEHGIDLDSVTWVRSGDEHVPTFVAPHNVISAPKDVDLVDLLVRGELDAVIGVQADRPDVRPVIRDPHAAAVAALRERGLYPINHLVVVRDDVLAHDPELAVDLVDAFTAAKRQYIGTLRDGVRTSAMDRELSEVMEITGGDPLPYGLRPNRQVLEDMVRQAHLQHILSEPTDLDGLFAEGTLDVEG